MYSGKIAVPPGGGGIVLQLGGDSRNFANLQIVNETANTMLQQCRLSWF
jgi:hypothetical protein